MDVKAKDFIREYGRSDADGRLDLMLNHYGIFPRIIRMLERRTKYKIKMFVAKYKYTKLQDQNGQCCMSKKDKVASLTPE